MRRNGWTLVEVMVVVLIVSILAAILVPLLTARIEQARWSEGKAGAGMLATAVRAYAAESQEDTGTLSNVISDYIPLTDLQGRYFDAACYSFTVDPVFVGTADGDQLQYTIQVDSQLGPKADLFSRVTVIQLNHLGEITDTTP